MSAPDAARWRQVDRLVEAALDRTPETRAAYLDEACAGDPALRREVESLLARDREDDFLATPATVEAAELLPGARTPSLAGQRVGRFAVLAPLGAGGMGEVYLAEDPRLERRVALKFPLAATEDDEVARERLRREARVAAALDHPAVCRVFELGEVGGRDFIVMEHLEGETLAARLERGPVPTAQALAWGAAIAAALEQAHDKGLVHRDLKPANVMVLPPGEVKVMDFGLARPLPARTPGARAAGGPEMTLGGALLGTPGYMAPEQLAGHPADPRSDVWALGCVLFQMLTGERAFAGGSTEEAAAAIREREPDWHRLPAETPEEVRRLLRCCLAKDPLQRLRHAGDVRLALAEARTGSEPGPRSRARGWRRALARHPLAAAAVVLLAVASALLVAALLRSAERGGDTAAADVSTFLGVSVPPFANRTGEPSLDPLGALAAEAIRSELPRLEFLRRPRGHANPVAAEAPAHTRVTGAYYLDGEQLRFTATLAGAGGEVLHAIEPAAGPRATPGTAIELARQRVLGALAAVLDPRYMPGPRSRPPLYDAYREFMAGVHLFGVDYDAAIPHFERAFAIDPEFFGALNVLATAHGNRGDREAQRRVLARAASMRHRLTQAERLTLDWSLAEADGRYLDALQAIRRRAELEPEHELVRYLHAFYALRLNRPEESVAASDRFDHGFWDSGPRGDWAWACRTDARHLLGRHEEELALARQARERHPSSLQARSNEASALAALGRIAELGQALDDALTLEGGPVQNPGLLLRAAAAELAIHGRPEAAAEVAARAVAWYRSRPPAVLDRPEVRLELGRALYLAGRWEEAAAVARELLAAAPHDFRHLGLAGLAAARRGDEAEARRLAAELAGRGDARGEVFLARARLAALLGERDQALDLLRDGIASGVYFGVALHRDPDLAALAGWPPYDELMRPKG